MTSPACLPASPRISMTATFQRDVHLAACFKNNPTGTGRCNYIHSTHVAHQSGILTLVSLQHFRLVQYNTQCFECCVSDIDECALGVGLNNCVGSACRNTKGSYLCDCAAGTTLANDQRSCLGRCQFMIYFRNSACSKL